MRRSIGCLKVLRAIGIGSPEAPELLAFASGHVQRGTPLYALQEMGGWESPEMVRRYAHFTAEHLPRSRIACALRGRWSNRWAAPAARLRHSRRRIRACIAASPFGKMARPAGFEPTTPWFVAKYSIQLSYGRARLVFYMRDGAPTPPY